ncbi:MAG: HpsJ family protein [Cyanobacteria bacterium]|nr:HpsJ family protein [Cyanobacteriota bacterium]MDW8202920.1 HpsJ family protein [Cyanobacteriota bacterium SKYGB_h_bin112]
MTNSSSTATDGTKSIIRFRWIGYGLLVFALVDVIEVLVPPQFTNASWELQAIGQLVERAPVPLIGMALVFYGEQLGRSLLESLLLRVLSWLSILLMVVFLLLVPLGVVNTFKINTQTVNTIDNQVQQQFNQLDQIQQQVDKASAKDLENLAEQLRRAGVPEITSNNPEELKREVKTRVTAFKEGIKKQAAQEKTNRFRSLLERAVKWNIGAIITSVLFFAIWKTSRWAR